MRYVPEKGDWICFSKRKDFSQPNLLCSASLCIPKDVLELFYFISAGAPIRLCITHSGAFYLDIPFTGLLKSVLSRVIFKDLLRQDHQRKLVGVNALLISVNHSNN